MNTPRADTESAAELNQALARVAAVQEYLEAAMAEANHAKHETTDPHMESWHSGRANGFAQVLLFLGRHQG